MKKLREMDFDVSDTPREPTPPKRKGPPAAVPVRRDPAAANRGHAYNPGMPPERRKNEARPSSQPTQQLRPQPQQGGVQQVSTTGKYDVTLPDGRVIRIPASSPQVAQQTAGEWLKNNPATQKGAPGTYATMDDEDRTDAEHPQGATVDYKRFQVQPSPNEGVTAGNLAGFQEPTYEQRLRQAVREMVREVVRRKEGGGGFNLYPPNKGKKKGKKQKSVGTFPTRLAAKSAELARFPPKDPEQLKKLRKRLDKLKKDPKKRSEAEKRDLMGPNAPKKVGKPAKDRKKAKKEAFIRAMVRDLHERLFHEDEVPGSHWDEHILSMKPEVVASDKRLHGYHKNMQVASIGALRDAHKAMMKAMKGTAKVHPGDAAFDPERKKMFMPVMLDVDGAEIGPVHLYVDGGHVKIEVSDDARNAIAMLDPPQARDVRGGLMSFQEDHLPEIDTAKKAWNERDSYLDKVHAKLEKQFGGMSDVERHLAKPMLTKGGKK